jgi:hypothetical protein
MLTRPSQFKVYLDALKVLIDHGDPNTVSRVEEVLGELLRREPALKGKVEVLIAVKDWIEAKAKPASDKSRDYTAAILDHIAKRLRDFGPPTRH